jgi:uncharacterized protein YciI
MQFALVALDRPNALARRMELRPDHLKHLEGLGEQVVLAGPFLDEKGDMAGTIAVIEAESLEAAREIFARDPFVAGGLFDTIIIKPWRLGLNNTHK